MAAGRARSKTWRPPLRPAGMPFCGRGLCCRRKDDARPTAEARPPARATARHQHELATLLQRHRTELGSFEDELMAGADCFVFDCDGVLWRGPDLIPGAVETINTLKKRLVQHNQKLYPFVIMRFTFQVFLDNWLRRFL